MTSGVLDKEVDTMHKELAEENFHEIAERGHAATDRYGNSLIQFDPKAETKLRRKIDIMIIPTVFLLYLFCFIDRANIGNAKLAGLEKDLKLVGYDYNTVLSVFYISYILFEIPSNMACKYFTPGRWIPFISLCFGVCSVGTAFVNDISAICGVRFVLGIFEAGMLPGIAYYLSRWYRRQELAFRLVRKPKVQTQRYLLDVLVCLASDVFLVGISFCTGLYVVAAPLAGAFGGLLASAILKLPHFGSLERWRMIFAIEGIITIGLSIISFFTLTDRPATAKWLTQEEKDLAIARIKSERISSTEVLDKFDRTKVFRGIFSPVTLACGLIFLLNNITVQGLAFFLPTIVRTIYPKSSVISQQLHTVPPYAVGALFTLGVPYISYKIERRTILFITSAPFVMIGYIMFLATDQAQIRYAATFIITMGAFSFGSLCNAHVSANVVSDTARSSAIGTNVMFGNIGGLISTWSFLSTDAPNYHIGNGLNLGTSTAILLVSIMLLLWQKRDNVKRDGRDIDSELAGKSTAEQQDMDWQHPGWRWKI